MPLELPASPPPGAYLLVSRQPCDQMLHPPVQKIADVLSRGLLCVQVSLGDRPAAPLRELLGAAADMEVPA